MAGDGVLACAGLGRRMVGPACLHGPAAGRAPTVLLVHGGYHGAWCWEAWVPLISAAGWGVAAMDLRGHGGLPQDGDFAAADIAAYAGDVRSVAEAIGGPSVLAGHSMGGAVAATAAAAGAGVGLVLLAPSPPGNVPGLVPLAPVPEGRPYGPLDEAACRSRFYPAHAGRDIGGLLRRLCPESPVALNERRLLRQRVDPAAIRVPVLCVFAGGDDPVLHAPGVDAATGAFFGAESHTVADAGHCFMLDGDVEAPVRILLDWLERTYG